MASSIRDITERLGRELDQVEPIPERPQRPVTGHSATTHISLGSIETICNHLLDTVQRLSHGAVAATKVKMEELEKLYIDAKEDYERAVAFDDSIEERIEKVHEPKEPGT